MTIQAIQTELTKLYKTYNIHWTSGEDRYLYTDINIPFNVMRRIAKLERMLDMYKGLKVDNVIAYFHHIPSRPHGYTYKQVIKKVY